MTEFVLLGINHKAGSLEIRERAALSLFQQEAFLKQAQELAEIESITVLSTCNRTEILALVSDIDCPVKALLMKLWQKHSLLTDADLLSPAFNFFEKSDAIDHFFKVAAGMDSQILGENQILGQVKDAFRFYCETLEPHPVLTRLFHAAFRCGKRVRSETSLGRGVLSLASAAVKQAEKHFGSLQDKSALLIGAGRNGQLTARHLKERGIAKLLIANRTPHRAETLAAQLGGETIPFVDWRQYLSEVDLILFCLDAPGIMLTAEQIVPHANRSQLLIDLCLPRACDPCCGNVSGIQLMDLDDLQLLTDVTLTRRRRQLAQAETIVNESVKEFLAWCESLSAVPMIRALLDRAENIRTDQLEKYRQRFHPDDWDTLDELIQSLLGKIMHPTLEYLRSQNDGSHSTRINIALMKELFDLDDTKISSNDPARNAR